MDFFNVCLGTGILLIVVQTYRGIEAYKEHKTNPRTYD